MSDWLQRLRQHAHVELDDDSDGFDPWVQVDLRMWEPMVAIIEAAASPPGYCNICALTDAHMPGCPLAALEQAVKEL